MIYDTSFPFGFAIRHLYSLYIKVYRSILSKPHLSFLHIKIGYIVRK
jgi:hypothetical protein